MNDKPIGIFDSGLGGLTVLKEIIEILPKEKYIYYADTDNVPYGIKQKEEVKRYINKAVEFLIQKDVKTIVIACNTATSIAINELRKKYTIPIIGIEPAVKPAIENRGEKKVLIMATPTTIKEEKLHNLLDKFKANEFVDLIAMPKLVGFAENGDFETKEVKEYIDNQLKEFNLSNYSEVVLGCTHFPYFKEVISEKFSKFTNIIDGSLGVANRLKYILEENEILGNNEFNVEYYCSGRKIEEKSELIKIEELMRKVK